jgi:hypothetical protein
MSVSIVNFLQHIVRSPAPIAEFARDGKGDAFADNLKRELKHLHLNALEDQKLMHLTLRRGRGTLPQTMPVYELSEHAKLLEHVYMSSTFRHYLIYSTHSSIDLFSATTTLNKLFEIPMSEFRLFVRAAEGAKIPLTEHNPPGQTINVEVQRVKGSQYKRPMYELYIMNAALSVAIAAFLVGCHYNKVLTMGEGK